MRKGDENKGKDSKRKCDWKRNREIERESDIGKYIL